MGISIDRRDVIVTAVSAMALCANQSAGGASTRDGARAFDFLMGPWNVRHRQLRKRLAGSTDWFGFPGTLSVRSILGGIGNFDRNELTHPKGFYEAHSLRLFDPATDRWSIWWLDSRAPSIDPPVVGTFDGRKGTFFSDDTFDSKPIRVRTTYEPLSSTTAQWTQAFSADREATWEVNWIMDFTRRSA